MLSAFSQLLCLLQSAVHSWKVRKRFLFYLGSLSEVCCSLLQEETQAAYTALQVAEDRAASLQTQLEAAPLEAEAAATRKASKTFCCLCLSECTYFLCCVHVWWLSLCPSIAQDFEAVCPSVCQSVCPNEPCTLCPSLSVCTWHINPCSCYQKAFPDNLKACCGQCCAA